MRRKVKVSKRQFVPLIISVKEPHVIAVLRKVHTLKHKKCEGISPEPNFFEAKIPKHSL